MNSLLFLLNITESIPHNFTPRIIKGITVVLSFIFAAFPHAATIPLCLVCEIALDNIVPPTVSTTPSHKPFPKTLGSPSKSFLSIIFDAPSSFK